MEREIEGQHGLGRPCWVEEEGRGSTRIASARYQYSQRRLYVMWTALDKGSSGWAWYSTLMNKLCAQHIVSVGHARGTS